MRRGAEPAPLERDAERELEAVVVSVADRGLKARDRPHLDAARHGAVIQPLPALERVVAEDRHARIAERADAHVGGHVGVAALERGAAHRAEREPARGARDVAARDVALAAERSLALAREPKGESAVVVARAAAECRSGSR